MINVINRNKALIEPFTDVVDEAFTRCRNDLVLNTNSYAQQKSDEVEQELIELVDDEKWNRWTYYTRELCFSFNFNCR